VFLAFVSIRRTRIAQVGSGRFWCLRCETERDYQRRTWVRSRTLRLVPVSNERGEFVLCRTCESAFDPECLDESSTALCEELLLEVPYEAVRARVGTRPRAPPAERLDQEE
jgi:hypothetical protein